MAKVGRNELCPCRSGKKYKKCCLGKGLPPNPAEVMRMFQAIEQERNQLRELGIFVNYVKPIVHQGKRVWVLGNRIYFNANPNQTFHEFIIWVLQDTLGKEWFDAEGEKPLEGQHFIYRCFMQFREWSRAHATPENEVAEGGWMVKPDGWTQSLLALAFDVASLQHANRLPDDLIKRLKGYDSYQGVRYEIGVAAIFARLGFDIDFIEAGQGGLKHCEFIARHQQTGMAIGVEAKSRHRVGVLHTPGSPDDFKRASGGIGKLYHKALQKDECGKMPFMIFIDVNFPVTEGVNLFETKWGKDVQLVTSETTPTAENPDPFNAVVFTNFSYHYSKNKELAKSGEMMLVIPQYTKFGLKDPSIFDGLHRALSNYGTVPIIRAKAN